MRPVFDVAGCNPARRKTPGRGLRTSGSRVRGGGGGGGTATGPRGGTPLLRDVLPPVFCHRLWHERRAVSRILRDRAERIAAARRALSDADLSAARRAWSGRALFP